MERTQPVPVVRVIGLCCLAALVAATTLARDGHGARGPGLPHASAAAATSSDLFTFVCTEQAASGGNNRVARSESQPLTLTQTVEVKWDDHFSSDNTVPGGGGNIHYVPATGNFVVTVKTLPPATPSPLPPLTESDSPDLDACPGGTVGYKEFTPDMQPTGTPGYLCCDLGDWNSMIVGDDLFVVKVWNKGPGTDNFWRLFRFNAVTRERLGMVDVPLEVDVPQKPDSWLRDDGPTMSYINGLITLSGDYWPGGDSVERGSHHHFVTTDLQLKGGKILASPDVPFHCPESSLRQLANGDILVFTGVHYFGPMKVMRLDRDWKFIDEHILRQDAFWPIGAVSSGGYWFVAYYDTSKWKKDEGKFPVYNIGLAAFDADWNLVQDEKLTDFDYAPEGQNQIMGDGISVELLGNHLYVSYILTEFKAEGGMLDSKDYVNVYELNQTQAACTSFTVSQTSATPSAAAGSQPVTVSGSPSGCSGGSWTASASDSWLSVSPSSGTGPGSVTVSWEANAGALQRTGNATIAGQTFTVTQAAGGTTALTSDWVPCGPPGGAIGGPGEDVIQPSRTRVVIARSHDGLHFERPSSDGERFLIDQADVPDAVVLPSGRVLVYFMAACKDYTPFGGAKTASNNIAVAVSDTGGAAGSWVFKDVSFDNAAQGLNSPFDPNIVLWKPAENLLRMFVSELPGASIATHSYTSTDGFTFRYEGKRYDPGPPSGIFDPETFRFDETHWYILTGSENGFATSSDDGSSFTRRGYFKDLVTNVTGYEGVPNEIAATNTSGTYRVFANSALGSRIDSLLSTTSPWTSWQWEGQVLGLAGGIESCDIGFPTVVRLASDDWLMFYRTGIPNCACGGEEPFHCTPPTSAPACYAFTISPTSAGAAASAGSQAVTVTGSPSGCTGGSWATSGNGSWLTVSPGSGEGSGSVTVSWTANAGLSQRTGNATIAGQTFTVTQDGGSARPHTVRRRVPRPATLPLRYLETVPVTPDAEFANGGLGYLQYVPTTDRFIVMVDTTLTDGQRVNLTWGSQTCTGRAVAYKEYDTDMNPTGSFGYFSCPDGFDLTTRLIENDLYLVYQVAETEWKGWRLERFDVTTWQRLGVTDVHLDFPTENDGGPVISYINGQVDVAGGYSPSGTWVGSHHHLFARDLTPLGKKILQPPDYPVNVPMLSMLQPADDIYLFAAGATGMTVLRLDKDWKLLEQKELLHQRGILPTGSVTVGGRFYVCYVDATGDWPNAALAVYDPAWNLLQDITLTRHSKTDNISTGYCWVEAHGGRIYASWAEFIEGTAGGGGSIPATPLHDYVDVFQIRP